MEIGQYLKQMRTHCGLSLKKVQAKTGISDSKLSRIEGCSPRSEPGPAVLLTLSKLYNFNLVECYRATGYLDEESLSSYKQVFQNTELLNQDERVLIQNLINMLTKERGSHDI
jgi:Uncharacterized protein conserved in bacteria